jgi:hypothetical protein
MTTPRSKRFLAAALCTLAAMLAVLPAAAGQGPKSKAPPATLDLPAYAAALGRCSDQISRLGHDPAKIARFRQSLPPEWSVRAEGRDFRVSTKWLDTALFKIQTHPAEANVKQREIRNHLAFLRAQAEALAAPSPVPPRAEARRQLDTIFRSSEFRGLAGPSTLELWWRRVTYWIGSHIMALLSRLHVHMPTGDAVAYVLIVLALVLLSLLLWRNLAGRSRQTQMRIEQPAPFFDSRAWVREALQAAARGEYREAIHCAYWGGVARLEDLGAFPRDRTRTPRELLRLLDSRPEQKAPFRDLATRFELVWYGCRLPSATDWENAKTQLERMGCLGISTAGTANS